MVAHPPKERVCSCNLIENETLCKFLGARESERRAKEMYTKLSGTYREKIMFDSYRIYNMEYKWLHASRHVS